MTYELQAYVGLYDPLILSLLHVLDFLAINLCVSVLMYIEVAQLSGVQMILGFYVLM